MAATEPNPIASETSRIPASVRAVVFDAVGTLIRPEPSVAQIYAMHGARFGARLTAADVKSRFPAIYQRHFGARSTVGLMGQGVIVEGWDGLLDEPWRTSEALEAARWRAVITELFEGEVPSIEPLFASLWDYFGRAAGWVVFDDVAPTLAALAGRGYTLAIGSNFDARLDSLCRNLPALTWCNDVFPSSRLGWAKPSRRFFRAIEAALGLAPSELLLVGDDFRNDVAGAEAAGWHARWLVREPEADLSAASHQPLTDLTQLC